LVVGFGPAKEDRLGRRPHQLLAINARLIHQARHGIGVRWNADTALQHAEDLTRARDLGIEPSVLQLPFQDDGHPVVEPRHGLVRVGREDGKRGEFFTSRIDPHIVEPGKREILLIFGMDIVRRLVPSFALPLLEATGRHETAIVALQAAEGWTLREGLHPGINHVVGRFLIFHLMRNQAPTYEHDVVFHDPLLIAALQRKPRQNRPCWPGLYSYLKLSKPRRMISAMR
jgi:hypothetical protein